MKTIKVCSKVLLTKCATLAKLCTLSMLHNVKCREIYLNLSRWVEKCNKNDNFFFLCSDSSLTCRYIHAYTYVYMYVTATL